MQGASACRKEGGRYSVVGLLALTIMVASDMDFATCLVDDHRV